MKNLYYGFLFLLTFVITTPQAQSQCPTDLLTGQNLVTNGDFEQGYTGWTFTGGAGGYTIFNPPGWSNPGNIYVGTNPVTFNPGPPSFMSYGDHTSGSGNMLMVDGVCTAGIKLFQQTGIPIKPNTNYYFSVWISSLKDQPNFPGLLNFDINGTNIGALIQAPATGGSWIKYEIVWNSGATPPATVTISIENSNSTGCASEVDFAIDDIAFIPGCAYGSPGPQPNLGPDQTICGKGGSITLDSNVPHNATTTVTWSSNVSGTITGTGAGAPYTKVITAPGTYSVCVTDNGSCVKSDIIVITNTFSINLGPDVSLCNPASATFDAGFSGTGVTYKWYKNYPTVAPGTNNTKTYFVNSPGTYRVEVTDPVCGMQWDEVVVTTPTTTPINATYCVSGSNVTVSVSGAGTYNWYDTQSKGTGTLLGSGINYSTTSITAPNSYTFYVEDMSTTTGYIGATTVQAGAKTYGNTGAKQVFTASSDFQITDMDILLGFNYIPPAGYDVTITIEIFNSSGASFSPAKLFTSDPLHIASGSAYGLYHFTFAGFNIQSAWGPTLMMGVNSTTNLNGYLGWSDGGASYPYNYNPSGIVTITGGYNGGANASVYSSFYNWHVITGVPCARTPVQVIYDCPLPVDWISFDAIKQNGAVLLAWSTAKETDNSHFNVMRSTDGNTWTKIGSVVGNGTSSIVQSYNFIDNQPVVLTTYYKIVQVDYNGATHSTTIKSLSGNNWAIVAYPNPFDNSTNLVVSGSNEDTFTYTVHAITGQLVGKGTGTSNTEISLGDGLASGVYVVTVQLADDVKTIKITKK